MRHGAKRIGGRISALTMSATQINAAISDYAARGWPRRENYRPKMGAATGEEKKVPPAIAHVVRLWGRLGQAGKLNNASRMALLNFCDRQVGRVVMDLDSLTPGECTSVIEALKSWLARGA
jgi:hypothetical protein